MPGPDTMTQSKTNVSGPPKFKSVDHLSVPYRDLEEAIRFYRDVLGLEVTAKSKGDRCSFLSSRLGTPAQSQEGGTAVLPRSFLTAKAARMNV